MRTETLSTYTLHLLLIAQVKNLTVPVSEKMLSVQIVANEPVVHFFVDHRQQLIVIARGDHLRDVLVHN